MTMSLEEANAALTVPGSPFELDEVQIDGRPYRVWKNALPTLRAITEASVAHGDKVYIVFEDERITFAEHFRRVGHVARWLVEDQGVEKGDRVAIAMRNLPEFIVAFWAAASVGAIVVPLNGWWTGNELAYGLSDAGARVLLADGERVRRLEPELPGLDLKGVAVTESDELAAGQVSFADLIGDGDAGPLPDVNVEPEDPATILYTGGTTGQPKGALGSHRSVAGSVLGLAFMGVRAALRHTGSVPTPDPGAQEAMLIAMPMFHVSGLASVLITAAFGAKAVLLRKWDPDQALALIEQERVTMTGGVPTMVHQLLESPDIGKRDLSSLKGMGATGAPVLPDLLRRLESQFPGLALTNGYGLTETWGLVAVNTAGDYLARPDAVGLPLITNEIKLVDADGNEAPEGGTGELWVRGPSVMKGYWNRPEATSAAITDGWFHTGDVAKQDDEGFLFIVDRIKDMVIRGGENVYCVEVESVLDDHPDVVESAVIGVPHDVLGEEVGAVVVVRPGSSVTDDDLRAFVAERIAKFKVPTHVWLRTDPLPVSPIGKVLKQQLRDEVLKRDG
jgi:long-chain acyl-CoA synthetase